MFLNLTLKLKSKTSLFAPLLSSKKALLLAFGVAVSVSAAADSITPTCWNTSSSVRVCYLARHTIPIVDIEVGFAAGSAYDPEEKAGLSSITRRLMSRGTKTLSEDALLDAISDSGIELSGRTDWDRALFSLRSLSDAKTQAKGVELLADILQNPSFLESTFNREKQRIIAALKEDEESPDAVAGKAFYRAIYPDHPYGNSASTASVERIQRDDLVKFYQQYYKNGIATVSIVGDISKTDAERVAKKLTQSLARGQLTPVPPLNPIPNTEKLEIPLNTKQIHINIGLPMLKKGDPDFFPMIIANHILGGGMLSRLMQAVREREGLVYDVRSEIMTASQPGPFVVSLQTLAVQAPKALALVNQILNDFIEKGPTKAEFEQAQNYLVYSAPLRFESNASMMSMGSQIAFYDLPPTYAGDYAKRVSAVTLKQTQDAIKKYLANKMMITVVAGNQAAPNTAGSVAGSEKSTGK